MSLEQSNASQESSKIGMIDQFMLEVATAQEVWNSSETDPKIKAAVYGIVAAKSIAAFALLAAITVGVLVATSVITGALVYAGPALFALALVGMAISAGASRYLNPSDVELLEVDSSKKGTLAITDGIDGKDDEKKRFDGYNPDRQYQQYAENFYALLQLQYGNQNKQQ